MFCLLLLENDINGYWFLKLTSTELKEDLELSSLGKRKKILEVNGMCGINIQFLHDV